MTLFNNVGLLADNATLQRIEYLAMAALPKDLTLFNSYEAAWQSGSSAYLLACIDDVLQLIPKNKKLAPLKVDFKLGAIGFRGHQNVRNELLVKAVLGRDKQTLPSVIDATAGMGRDSFILAVLGCEVTLLERNPIVAALLKDGIMRYRDASADGQQIAARMRFLEGDFQTQAMSLAPFDVVYLDPMFPHREKSALVKKEMQIFKEIVGADADSDDLFPIARSVAKKRVVVKRPSKAEFLANKKPTYSVTGRSSRFDIYQC
ncbi:MAG: class I SAM-dependent methyltransferase [Pseudomonadales bacterium]|nr:class I SAM-dependent methyltransferase [Pseudomonadales bacterium]